MWTRFLLTLCITLALHAQQDPMALLRLAQARVADSLQRLPRYMCTQTIDRVFSESTASGRGKACDGGSGPNRLAPVSSDRLRLDVAMTATVEMYSWVGESRFNDRDLMEMVHEGAISTGSFAAFLTAIFGTEQADFTYNGDKTENGRAIAEFGFNVPYEKSHYRFGGGQSMVMTGYGGTFLVDRKLGDLLQLVVQTSRLPAETGACTASTTLDYARVHLNNAEFFLPTESRLRIVHTDGSESDNRTTFSNCHEFLGESTIKFDGPSDGSDTPGRSEPVTPVKQDRGSSQQSAVTIPPGQAFRVTLTAGVNTATAAVGDTIQAKLVAPISNGSNVLVPAGAAIVGRIIRVRQFYAARTVALGIRLETVEVARVAVPLAAAPDTVANFQQTKKGTLQRRVPLGTLRSLEDRSSAFEFRNVRFPYLIPSGLESAWVTMSPEDISSAPATAK